MMGECTIEGCSKNTVGNRKICGMHRSRYHKYKNYELPLKNKIQENGLMICIHHGILTQDQIQFRKTRRKFSDAITQACKECTKRSKRTVIKIDDLTISRVCKRCESLKNKNEFSDYEWVRRSPWCLTCKREKQNKINKTKAEKGQLTINKKRNRLKTNFGLTLDEFENIKKLQNNVCAICNNPESMTINGVKRELAVDHCHEAEKNGIMKIRGLLCRRCNNALGIFQDNIQLLEKAIKYLNQ